MPTARTAAQAEAARRNGARSRGPVTPEGKATASRNALKHGLAAACHLVLEGEDTAVYEGLLTRLVHELAPASELEAQLGREASRLLRELRQLRKEPLATTADEPENEPEPLPEAQPASTPAKAAAEQELQNEPEPPSDALAAAAMIATGEPLQILAAARFLGMEEEAIAYFRRTEPANTA